MRRISTFLIISLLLVLMNAATMPFDNNSSDKSSSSQTELSAHHHCDELQAQALSKNPEIKFNKSFDHFCCSIVAVIPTSTLINIPQQETAYLIRPLDKKISHIENSIYKPPRPVFS